MLKRIILRTITIISANLKGTKAIETIYKFSYITKFFFIIRTILKMFKIFRHNPFVRMVMTIFYIITLIITLCGLVLLTDIPDSYKWLFMGIYSYDMSDSFLGKFKSIFFKRLKTKIDDYIDLESESFDNGIDGIDNSSSSNSYKTYIIYGVIYLVVIGGVVVGYYYGTDIYNYVTNTELYNYLAGLGLSRYFKRPGSDPDSSGEPIAVEQHPIETDYKVYKRSKPMSEGFLRAAKATGMSEDDLIAMQQDFANKRASSSGDITPRDLTPKPKTRNLP
jgi:hypothetical protein